MEKILITGATGFIGKELVAKLKDKYEIHTLERYVTSRYSLDDNTINHYANLTEYKGFISDKQLDKEYQNASIFVSTSRSEAFSLVILEAQAHGLPVVSFAVSGPHDIIKKEFQGELIKPFDTDAFVDAILRYYKFWKNKKENNINAKRIIRYIYSKYADKRIIPKITDMLKNNEI